MKQQWQQILWMIIYLIAMPVFSFYIPLYSFWRFDDFSWGKTHLVREGLFKEGATGDEDEDQLVVVKWCDEVDFEPGKKNGIQPSAKSAPSLRSQNSKQNFDTLPRTNAPNLQFSRGFQVPNHSQFEIFSQRPKYQEDTISILSVPTTVPKVEFKSKRNGVTDIELKAEIRALIAGSDLKKTTREDIRKKLEKRFGIDLLSRTDQINCVIDDILK
jgi:chitin synthase